MWQPFNETRAGLDHVEFEVPSLDVLDSWRHHLDAEGVKHSGSKPHIVTFRDPDNIQLEFFCVVP
jgi:catechol 2,3-dioxygenase-like lactoylglutathione lyase family enzyme